MKKTVLSFVGGVVVALAGSKFTKSDAAHKLAVNTMATGMKTRDNMKATYETIKEDAQDLVYEAKAINEGE